MSTTEKTTEEKSALRLGSKVSPARARRKNVRELTRILLAEKQAANPDILFKRQIEPEEDPFTSAYDKHRLRKPIYDFGRLYTIYEESDILQSCVEAMQQNVDGFGHQFDFLGDDITERDKPETKKELKTLQNFFTYANESESWATIRKNMREDLEVLGNGALEVIRNRKGQVAMFYYIPFRYIRLSPLEREFQTVQVTLPREGKLTNIRIKKKFRRFAQLNQFEDKIRWFKEFGDKRIMDATTGDYVESKSQCKIVASEILHFKLSFGGMVYGLPRWIGAILSIMGRRSAQYVNYDLFNSQGIPPIIISVSGGVLSDDSLDELETMIRGMRGAEKWNRVALFESNLESIGMEEKGQAKIEIKNLAEHRKEDQMFNAYLSSSERDCRHRFRLPPLYIGAAETFTHATSKSARAVAEEQVFVPERNSFDEVINAKILINEMGVDQWRYRSLGPKIANPEEVSKGVEMFAKAGAFSVNHAIERANEAFGLQMSKYEEEWATLPLGLVMKMIELGQLTIDIGTEPPSQGEIQGGGRTRQGIPTELPEVKMNATAVKILKSDAFTKKEKRLYQQLLLIQAAMDSPDLSEEEDHIEP